MSQSVKKNVPIESLASDNVLKLKKKTVSLEQFNQKTHQSSLLLDKKLKQHGDLQVNLIKELQQLNNEKHNLTQNYILKEKTLKNLIQAISTTKAEINNLDKKIIQNQNTEAQLLTKITKKNSHIQELTKLTESKSITYNQVSERLNDLQSQFDKINNLTIKLTEKKNTLLTKSTDLSFQINKVDYNINQLFEKQRLLEEETLSLITKITFQEKNSQKRKNIFHEKRNQINELRKKKNELVTHAKSLEENEFNDQNKLNIVSAELKELQNNFDKTEHTLANEIEKYNKTCSTLQNLQKQKKGLAISIKKSQKDLIEATDKSAISESILNKSQTAFHYFVQEYTKSNELLENAKASNANLHYNIQRDYDKLLQIQSLAPALKNMTGEAHKITEQEHKLLLKKMAKLNSKITEINYSMAELNKQNKVLSGQLFKIKESYDVAKKEKALKEINIGNLKTSVKELSFSKKEYQEKIESINTHNDKLQTTFNDLYSRKENLTDRVNTLKLEHSKVQSENHKLNSLYNMRKKETTHSHDNSIELQIKIKRLAEENAQLESKIEGLSNLNLTNTENEQNLISELDEVKKKNESLTNNMMSLQAKVEKKDLIESSHLLKRFKQKLETQFFFLTVNSMSKNFQSLMGSESKIINKVHFEILNELESLSQVLYGSEDIQIDLKADAGKVQIEYKIIGLSHSLHSELKATRKLRQINQDQVSFKKYLNTTNRHSSLIQVSP